jgi:Glutaredoxin and related proteins
MADFVLYGTEGCHLCDDAERLLLQASVHFDAVDIINDQSVQQRYAVRIPVLMHRQSGSELGWPFDDSMLRIFLAGIDSASNVTASSRSEV